MTSPSSPKASVPNPSEPRPPSTRRRLPGVPLKPGTVKQARREAGLSLAQVGKGRVTAPAIYLIETGKTKPSMPTLEHIAERTGKPVEFFLAEPGGPADDSQAAVIELEALVGEGKSAEAMAMGHRLLDRGSSAFRLGRIRFLLAQAYRQASQLGRAAGLLEEARVHFEAVNDGLMLAECLGAQAELAGLMQSPDALPLARQALATCRGLQPVPTLVEARLLGTLAGALMGHREWDAAVACYQEAIAAAGALFDLRRLVSLYSRLSAAYRESGQAEAAGRYAARSAALHEVIVARQALAHHEHALGLLLMTQGKTADARAHLDRAVELAEAPTMEAGTSQLLLSLCELALERDSAEQALEFAQEALQVAGRQGDKVGAAESHVWLSRIAERSGDNAAVDREFELAIAGLEELGLADRLLQCHSAYAEILERRGELSKAYAHMKQAVLRSRPKPAQGEEEGERADTA